jgi:biopolymer transport protein ExbB
VISGLSVLALALVLLKLAQFTRQGLFSRGRVDRALAAWHAGEVDLALSHAAATRHPAAAVAAQAIRGLARGRAAEARLQDMLAQDGARRLAELSSHLRLLELIATLTPLLGLLGTVLGMIDAFQALEAAGQRVNPALLSGGIWVALLTTAAGLVVAIRAAAAHNLFEGAIERTALAIEDATNQVLTGRAPSEVSPRLGFVPAPAE